MTKPLAGMTIVDLLDPSLGVVTRIYADLGATVVRPENPALSAGAPVSALVADVGKTALSPAALADAIATADMVVYGRDQGADLFDRAADAGNPARVLLSVTPFGRDNSYEGWHATDAVLHALSGGLSRSGIAGREPLLPPGDIAWQCAMAQASYVGMVALYAAAATGTGERVDISLLDGAVQALDPGFGISGSATLGRSAVDLPPGRPVKGFQYPILPCADGHVRLCLLAPRQWRNMHRWMGEPAEFADAAFDSTAVRQQSAALTRALADFCRSRTRVELEDEGMAAGVPISGLLSLAECLRTPHVAARRALTPVTLAGGRQAVVPNGVIEIDGARMGPGPAAPAAPVRAAGHSPATGTMAQPMAGLRVLDLGVIVVGGEQGRLLADLGADVVKVESQAFPDGTRHSYLPTGLSVSFAAGHRNKRSLGLDLRQPDGKALFLRLAAEADVILSNFKPGTMESLGFGPAALAAVNPKLVTVESSAFGATGPWAARMGYGPLVRAAAGLTARWRYPDDPESFSDPVTIYPDHVGARYGALATLALLLRRLRTGAGGRAAISQMEVMLHHFAGEIADEAAATSAPSSLFRAAGEDEWCVVTVRHPADRHALAEVVGADGDGDDLDAVVADWMRRQDADSAMRRLQRAGVPAARMLRTADLQQFGYFKERDFFRVDRHPHMDEPIVAERAHARFATVAAPPARPAPLLGEQSADVLRDWLGLDETEIARLLDAGTLQPVPPAIAAMVAAGEGRRPAGTAPVTPGRVTG